MAGASDPTEAASPAPEPQSSEDTAKATAGDRYDLSGDFRGAVINIKSTIVSNDEVKDIESLPPEPGDPPYQGMQFFGEKDADRFFGREALVAKIAGRLAKTRFLAIIGASGSGKSSLVRAGVVPALRRGDRLADGSMPPLGSDQWDIRIFTPGPSPLESLANSLASNPESVEETAALQTELTQSPEGLSGIAARVLKQNDKAHLLLVIDQFEEVFTQCHHEEEQKAFINNLLHAVDPAAPQPITILLTLRADLYAQLAAQDRLRDLVSQNQEFIGAMTRDELTRAILRPAALGNWKVQEGLVDVMLDDLGDEPGALPLLSHALLETWKRRHGRVMTLSGYVASGGVRGAIAQTAETVFRQRLTPAQQAIARIIFVKLAEMGESSLDTRRRASFSELITRSTDLQTIDAVLSILTEARLVTTDTVEPGDTRVVEISHEALIREWPTLRDWLNQDREGLILHQQLTEDVNEWLKLNRDPGALYRGARLDKALAWASANADMVSLSEQEFLDASKKVSGEEQGRVRMLARARGMEVGLGSAAALLIVVVLVLVLAVNGIFAPRKMSGVFNIAVAQFGEMGADGQIRSSDTGKTISGWAANYMRDQLKSDPNVQIWPNQGNLFNRTQVALATPQTAGTLADSINAGMLLYGYVDKTTSPPQLVLKFWIAPQAKYQFEDLQGNFAVGGPIRIADLNNPGISVQGELSRQSGSLAWIAMGIAQEQLGQSQDALQAFQHATELAPQSEAVQFFLGREYLFLSDSQADSRQQDWQSSEEAFQKAISLNKTYAPAYIGLGSLYFKRASYWLDANPNATPDQIRQSQAPQWVQQTLDAYQEVLTLKPSVQEYGSPVQDVATLALGNAYRLKAVLESDEGDQPASLESVKQALTLLDMARPAFEASVQQHESYRRYLAQTYEHLGETYQWQGYILELQQDKTSALQSYQQAVTAYQQCIAQGDPKITSDLIIQNDIVGQFCKPYLQDTQQSLDALK